MTAPVVLILTPEQVAAEIAALQEHAKRAARPPPVPYKWEPPDPDDVIAAVAGAQREVDRVRGITKTIARPWVAAAEREAQALGRIAAALRMLDDVDAMVADPAARLTRNTLAASLAKVRAAMMGDGG